MVHIGTIVSAYADGTHAGMAAGPRAGDGPPPLAPQSAERLPVAELRRRALEMVERRVPGFAARLETLHPYEDNVRGRVYIFRWDDYSTPLAESAPPPFLEVRISAHGDLVSFTDRLSR